MIYDAKVPQLLKREQEWFGSIIRRPIDEDSRMNSISPDGQSMEIEAAEHIAPSPTLRPAQRIQIYNQQFWWRLLSTMHDTFPLLTRMFGYYDFNKMIGIPYLVNYPPSDWSLNVLGDRLVKWIDEEYKGEDKTLVLNAAKIDWSFSASFVVKQLPPLTTEEFPNEAALEGILSRQLYTQPHLHLFRFDSHLFNFRNEFLKHDPDYWLEHDFPENEKGKMFYFVLYRNQRNDISWKDISEGEYHLLSFFQQGMSIEVACHWLEAQENSLHFEAMHHLQSWFQEWTQRGWLTLVNPLYSSDR